MKEIIPVPGMRITESVRFAPGEYDFFGKDGIIAECDDIVIDGCGATLAGGHIRLDADGSSGNTNEFGYVSTKSADNAKALGFYGVGIKIAHRNNVIVKNLNFRGFDIGAHILFSSGIVFENCDFSGCFTDPAWGWDDHGFHGGILMEYTNHSTIDGCRANNVWDALNMRYSDYNTVTRNNFSHTSDTGLKLWNSCHNLIEDNDFSYGIRIDPGEVHARDSSSVLIESGSNFNVFRRNDMTHGGDGLFIRVLNGWMSTNNLFEENDCSYANNNAIEAWADNNTYIRNKANYSSYGFWLGNSDNTVLIGNEVAYNGGLHHNAPEAFGNCGIAVVNGSGSHYIVEDNYIHDNTGPGIAIRFKKDYPSFHWIIQNNRIENNKSSNLYKGHGIYAKHARFLTIGRNDFSGNEGEDIYFDGNVSDVTYLEGGMEKPEKLIVKCDSRPVKAGIPVRFSVDADDSLNIRWDLGDGTVFCGSAVTHIYKQSGFYRLAVTCDNGQQAVSDFMNVFVCENGPYIELSESSAKAFGEGASYRVGMNNDWTVSGNGSLEVMCHKGKEHTIELLTDSLPFDGNLTLSGYFRYLTDCEPDWNKELISPFITLYQDDSNFISYEPLFRFSDVFSYTESRNNWVRFRLDEGFASEETGRVEYVKSIKVTFRCIDDGYTYVYLDALCFVPKALKQVEHVSLSKPSLASEYPRVICEGALEGSCLAAPVSGSQQLFGDITERVVFDSNGYYGVEFGTVRMIDSVDVWLYENTTKTLNSRNETIPVSISVEYLKDNRWISIRTVADLQPQRNTIKFDPVLADAVRIVLHGDMMAIYGFKAYNTMSVPGIVCRTTDPNELKIDEFQVKLRKELNGNGNPLGDLVAKVFTLDSENKLADCLFETVIPEKEIISGGVSSIKANLTGLRSGTRYALALGQTQTAKSRTEGDYYRWIAGHAGYHETFAIYTDGQTKESDYDWGTAWLKVVCEGICADYSHDSEHIGIRFGLEDMQYRYMTFTMPDSISTLTDGIAAAGAGYKLDSGTLTVDLAGKTASGLHIWVDKKGVLIVNGKQYAVEPGFNSIKAASCGSSFSDSITITSGSGFISIYEIEAIV